MKKSAVLLLAILLLLLSPSALASKGGTVNWDILGDLGLPKTGGSWTPANVDTPLKPDSVKKDISDLKGLYEEFQRYWTVKDKDDLQERFEEFLKSKDIYTKEIENYDEFMETWVDHYDEDLDFDELYDAYDLGTDDIDDPDEYDVLLDDDVDDLYDDYLDDYIDEEYYEDYGEYFDEVYYD